MLTTPLSLGGLAPRPVVPTAGAARGGAALRWLTQSQCPADWWIRVERCGGGFFHTPPGLDAGAPAGEPVFAQLWHGDEVVGVATGVRSRCRFGREPRHLYFPTVPALTGPPQGDEALGALVDTLRAEGAVEVTVDSFDAGWRPQVAIGERVDSRDRVEYLVPLDADPDELARRCHKHHRRHLQNGMGQGWRFQALDGPEARAVLATVQQAAAVRAAGRGDPFQAMLPLAAGAARDGAPHWGVATFSAWEGDAPLAAALVGRTPHRGYYLVGGSTPAGYACNAAIWLHWRIMCHLAEQGVSVYNLGGTPASAELPSDPQHGLYRFKSGFGAQTISCRSVRWALGTAHLRAHRVASWLTNRLHT
jgi:Acetyltransferase (GNAT) domain